MNATVTELGRPQIHSRLETDDSMFMVLLALQAAPVIAIDTETTGLNVRNGVHYLQGICYSTGEQSGYIPLRHKDNNVSREWIDKLYDILCKKDIIWHNQKFDYHSLKTLGMDPTKFEGRQYDTMIIAHLVNEEIPSKELDYLCKIYLRDSKAGGDEIKGLGLIYGWENIPARLMAPYGAYDAFLTFRLWEYFWPKLVEQELESVYWDTESPFLVLLFEMEQRGVGVDRDLASRKAERGQSRLHTIRRRLGFDPASPVALGNYLLDELGLPVLGRTPKGKPSFAKAVMEQYDDILQASNNPTAQLVAEFRGWQKAVTSLYLPLLEKTGPDGRIRTQFKQHGTVTGRLSASDPNLQQVPRGSNKPWNGDAKACFISGIPDFSLIGWDYSQIELRFAAAYGREQLLLTEFEREGADPFNVLAPIIFGTLNPDTRQDTKTFVYSNLFGAGLSKIAATLGRPEVEVRPLYERYRQSISGITEVSQQVGRLMEQKGYIKYWDGRRRHMRDKRESYKAWNSLIQGGSAQLVKKAMLRCNEFTDDDCRIVLTVHDEITFLLRTEAIPDYEPKIVKAMTDWPDFGVRFAVDGKEWKAAA